MMGRDDVWDWCMVEAPPIFLSFGLTVYLFWDVVFGMFTLVDAPADDASDNDIVSTYSRRPLGSIPWIWRLVASGASCRRAYSCILGDGSRRVVDTSAVSWAKSRPVAMPRLVAFLESEGQRDDIAQEDIDREYAALRSALHHMQ